MLSKTAIRKEIRKEATFVPLSSLDTGLSHHSKPVVKDDRGDDNSDAIADLAELMLPDELETRMFAHQRLGLGLALKTGWPSKLLTLTITQH
jgi:hypothetical protein